MHQNTAIASRVQHRDDSNRWVTTIAGPNSTVLHGKTVFRIFLFTGYCYARGNCGNVYVSGFEPGLAG